MRLQIEMKQSGAHLHESKPELLLQASGYEHKTGSRDGIHWRPTLSTELCSVWQRQGLRCKWHGAVSGEGWGLGKGSAPEGGGHGTACPGQRAWPWAAGAQGTFGQCSHTHRIWILCGAVWIWELDSVILVGLFQIVIIYDSMNERKEGMSKAWFCSLLLGLS